MEQIGYGEHIAETVKNIPYEAAIQTENIAAQLAGTFDLPYAQAKALTNVKLKRMADKGEIERLQKGVYCQVKQTVFGRVTPSMEQVMKKTLTEQNGARIGYESGAYLMNQLGLTTLIPRDMEITTNRYSAKLPKDCHIKLKKPAVPVKDENWKYLQFIDLTMALSDAHIDVEKPGGLLAGYAKQQELDGLALLFTARKHYPAKVILPLIDLLMEVNDELTSG
ncbi:type IV toxin-antitoxin system AbiEi family antitoxin domain-containing protein [Bacillaceae bacterium Marseille-Q3522]|jgi:hypothetical protein|nr:type IV toxin-antitoxin system AbiEi family antitoxin domain-containing protein [Bacillaceae bacterium Marseille-Q3522]